MLAAIARIFFLIGAGLGLAACMSIPVTSLPKLAALSPETMDASAMEVAVRAPDAYALPPGSVKLTFAVWREDGDQTREEAFDLVPVGGPLTKVLNGKQKAGYTIHRLHVATEDAPRVVAFKDHALSLREVPGKKSLSVSARAFQFSAEA